MNLIDFLRDYGEAVEEAEKEAKLIKQATTSKRK